MRTFSLKSDEAYEALRVPPDPYGWGPRLSREPNFPKEPDYVSVITETEVEARTAFKEWLRHVDNGRIGPQQT
jgi:hypothetical protein